MRDAFSNLSKLKLIVLILLPLKLMEAQSGVSWGAALFVLCCGWMLFIKFLSLYAQLYYSLMSSLVHNGVLKCAYGLRLPIHPLKLFLDVRDIVLLFQK